jgi:hypothetical protein
MWRDGLGGGINGHLWLACADGVTSGPARCSLTCSVRSVFCRGAGWCSEGAG